MVLRDPITVPETFFRLLGYAGLGLVAVAGLVEDGPPALWLLLAFTLLWPPVRWQLTAREPRLRSPASPIGQLAHALECLAVMTLVLLAAVPVWLLVAVGLLLLTGVTALGGLRLLGPCALTVAGVLLLGVPSRTGGVDPVPAASAALVASFLLGLAFASFRRARFLEERSRRARSESTALAHRNQRLARYVPGTLGPLIGDGPTALNRPREQFASVAFIDVVGFAGLTASRPMAELVDVVNDFIVTVTRLTERRGGVLGKFLGDGVLVYFPEGKETAPEERWRDAASCARLCLDLGAALPELARLWRRQGLSTDLIARAGIACGYCAIGDWGAGARLDYTIIGNPVNLASRLQAAAAPGGVLLSAEAAALVREDRMLADGVGAPRSAEIKGFGRCMVHELTASAKVRASLSAGSPASNHGQDLPEGVRR